MLRHLGDGPINGVPKSPRVARSATSLDAMTSTSHLYAHYATLTICRQWWLRVRGRVEEAPLQKLDHQALKHAGLNDASVVAAHWNKEAAPVVGRTIASQLNLESRTDPQTAGVFEADTLNNLSRRDAVYLGIRTIRRRATRSARGCNQ